MKTNRGTFLCLPALLVAGAFLFPLHVFASTDVYSETREIKERIAYHSFRLVLSQMLRGDLTTQRELLEQTVAGAPQSVEARFLLAYVYERTQAMDKAKAQYREILKLKPDARFAALALENSNTTEGQEQSGSLQKGSTPTPDLSRYEQQLVDLLNEERTQKQLRPLKVNLVMAAVARGHSEEMRDKNYFSHDSPTSALRSPLDRYMTKFDRRPRVVAENLSRRWANYEYSLNAANVTTSHNELMNSLHHRENILLPEVTEVGVGIAVNERGDFWITEMFAKPGSSHT